MRLRRADRPHAITQSLELAVRGDVAAARRGVLPLVEQKTDPR
jgi:hypothetical protein